MEADAIPMLIGGFCVVIIITFVAITILWRKTKIVSSYVLFIGQLVFLSLGFKVILKINNLSDSTYNSILSIDKGPISSAMFSEEISMIVATSAVLWAISMFLMLFGIWELTNKNKNKIG